MRPYDYYGKNVIVTCMDGKVFSGKLALYTSALDDPDDRANISIRPYPNAGFMIDIYEDDIRSIVLMK